MRAEVMAYLMYFGILGPIAYIENLMISSCLRHSGHWVITNTMRPKMITPTSLLFFVSLLHRTSVTHGFWQGFVYAIRRLNKVLSVNANYTRIIWESTFQLHAQLLHKRGVSELFPNC